MRGKRKVAARPRQAEIQVNPVAVRGDRAMAARDMKRTPERQSQLRHSIAGEYRRLARSCQARRKNATLRLGRNCSKRGLFLVRFARQGMSLPNHGRPGMVRPLTRELPWERKSSTPSCSRNDLDRCKSAITKASMLRLDVIRFTTDSVHVFDDRRRTSQQGPGAACCFIQILSGHPKPANDGHLKTGQR
jgi:hypothetical protein